MNNQMNRKKAWLIPLIPLGIAAIGAVVMLLWNALIPDIFHLGEITFWQALGLLVLSKILFSGGPRGGHHRRHHDEWRGKMREKWEHMTPEERQKFKMKLRYKGGFGDWEFETGHHDKDKPSDSDNKESPFIETK